MGSKSSHKTHTKACHPSHSCLQFPGNLDFAKGTTENRNAAVKHKAGMMQKISVCTVCGRNPGPTPIAVLVKRINRAAGVESGSTFRRFRFRMQHAADWKQQCREPNPVWIGTNGLSMAPVTAKLQKLIT